MKKAITYCLIFLSLTILSCWVKMAEYEFKTIKNVIETKLSKWKEFSLEKNPGFDLNSFKFQWENTLNPEREYHYTKEDHNALDSIYYFCFSPDSTKYVDIYSSHARLDSVNGSIQAAFEIDSDAHLIDLIKKKYLSVLIFGTTASLDDIAWIDNNSFV